jgi:predicted metal-dependent hydrolase
METTGSHRLFYQGLIQAAVGFYHLENGNYKGACSQFGKALAKLQHYMPSFHSVETARLAEEIRTCLNDAERLRDGVTGWFDQSKIPRIQRCVEADS